MMEDERKNGLAKERIRELEKQIQDEKDRLIKLEQKAKEPRRQKQKKSKPAARR